MGKSINLRHCGVMAVLWLGTAILAQAEGLNDAFGIELWTSPSLWSDNAAATAKRLNIRGNDNTGNAHFKGTLDEKQKVLGARAYSLELYARDEKIDKVSIGFVNRADLQNELEKKQIADKKGPNTTKFPVLAPRNQKDQEIDPSDIDQPKLYLELEKRMAAEKEPAFQTIVKKLTERIGKPNDGDETNLKRWIWSGHRFIAEDSATAVTLKIEPVQMGAATGNTNPDQKVLQVTTKLANSVQRRGNGDVVIGGIPPISQGDRGFCVPASWEKILRYYGLDFDVYQLADKGGTGDGGSAFIPFAAKMSALLEKENYVLDFTDKSGPNLMEIRSYVDRGIPLIWGISLPEQDFRDWVDRSKDRGSKLPELKAKPAVAGAKPSPIIHHCLSVIGYNAGFQEVALSDSTELGSGIKEIWISLADAMKADAKQGMIAVVPKKTAAGSGAPATSSGAPAAPASGGTPSGKKWY